jgi:rhodanese-related sulfurtransferase
VENELAPREVAALWERGEIELVDVREPEEYEAGRIAGARHIPLTELTAQAHTIGQELPIVFYCRVGNRSGMAADAFRASGFDAHNMSGGLEDWQAQGLPLEPEDGHVA